MTMRARTGCAGRGPLFALLLAAAALGAPAGCHCATRDRGDAATDAAVPATDAGGGDTDAVSSSEAGATDGATDAAAPACEATASSTLPDVTLSFPPQDCTFTLAEAAAGISITYEVAVAAPVDMVTPAPQDAGGCGPITNPSGLLVFELLGGGGQQYCLCDVGLCAPGSTTIQLVPGNYGAAFTWTGRNWDGPSDTGNPMGAPFPPGDYTLAASAIGTFGAAATPFNVAATFVVHLVP
ncbi:MAG TPA: hypothetical protein VG389_20060 [Myxococcota bacterium]|jgi:hypothetical protein|nr:hypothetical protein [Myxococcota bacterium]